MYAISRRLALLALGTVTLFTAGCDDDDPSGPETLSGTYALVSVNGEDVPATAYEGDDLGFYLKVELLSGSITFDTDGTFEDVTTARLTIDTEPPETSTETIVGTYTRSGNTLTLTDSETEDSYTLTIQGDGSLRQTENVEGVQITARYVRQ